MQNNLLKKTLVFTILILFAGMVIIPSIGSVNNIVRIYNSSAGTVVFNPFEEGWKYCKKITIDHNNVGGNLVSFPVLVSIIDSDLRDKAQPDGDDILFMDGKGEANQLFHEIESFVGFNGELVAWVNIPALSNSVDTVFYMYYGNSNCSTQEFPESVWDSYYCGVWHMNDFHDSTYNGNNGINYGTDDCLGKIGNSKNFVRNNHDYISLGDMPEPADGSKSKATFEVWIYPEIVTYSSIICKRDSSFEPDVRIYNFPILDTGQLRFSAYSGTDYPEGRYIKWTTNNALVTSGTWQYIVVVVDLSISRDSVFYYNGEAKSNTVTIEGTPPSHFYDSYLEERLGKYAQESQPPIYYDGSMDELRVSKTCRSAEWISTQYTNQNNVLDFLNIGSEEDKPRQKSYDNIGFLWFLERFPILERLLTLLIN